MLQDQMYRHFDQTPPLAPEIDKLFRQKEEIKLKSEIAEPFWAWHDRREHETKRMVANDIAGRCADSSIQPGHPDYGMVFSDVARVVRDSGVASQSSDRQDAVAMGLDPATLETRDHISDNGERDGGISLPFHLGNEQGGIY